MGTLNEYLGSGYTFDVYTYGAERVIKFARPPWKVYPLHCFEKIRQGSSVLPHNPYTTAYQSLQGLYLRNLERPELLGDPEIFPDELYYTQRRVSPTDDVLRSTPEKGRYLVESYIDLVKSLWEEGIGELTWNWTINTGMAEGDKMILTGLGELTFSYQRVRDEVRAKKWTKQMSANDGLRHFPDLRQYYLSRMDEEIGERTLRNYWHAS